MLALPPTLEVLRVPPGEDPGLDTRDPGARCGLADKHMARAEQQAFTGELALVQNRLLADGRRSVLLVLQGMDAAGKDGTIRNVFTGVNPQGCRVVSFKPPAGVEVEHDYLWRVHQACPRRGEIGIFNRSHYEDVVTVRVRKLVPEERWRRRVGHVNDFERLLHDEGTTIIKVFLHLSREEQRRRLQSRLDNPEKVWKFQPGDLDDRAHWDDYVAAYGDCLTETSTPWAPWYVVPADHKWVRNLIVSELLVHHLRAMDPQVPVPDPHVAGLQVD